MPVIVVGADGALGTAVIAALAPRDREVRAFLSDPSGADALRAAGVRVAVGDPADPSHVAAAATGCFTTVLLAQGHSPAVLEGWARAATEADVTRAIWVGEPPEVGPRTAETAVVEAAGRSPGSIAAEVADLDDRAGL